MEMPFALAAEAVRNIATWERHRIEFVRWHALIGQVEPPDGMDLAGWRTRLRGLNSAAAILTVLAAHESAARALDRRLALPLLCAGKGAPTMWPTPASSSEVLDAGAQRSPLTGDEPAAG
jgi:hypothetical protein